jgi:hypothetical protein
MTATKLTQPCYYLLFSHKTFSKSYTLHFSHLLYHPHFYKRLCLQLNLLDFSSVTRLINDKRSSIRKSRHAGADQWSTISSSLHGASGQLLALAALSWNAFNSRPAEPRGGVYVVANSGTMSLLGIEFHSFSPYAVTSLTWLSPVTQHILHNNKKAKLSLCLTN